jgi:16S rRNA (adenine1518-N6/adenine1519-N6)-dimethyltransferase
MTQGKRRVQELLARYDLVPRRAFGQHFLADPNLISKMVGLASAESGSLVVEVGAGTGSLTRALGEAGFRVVAYEVDERLRPLLDEVLEGLPGVEVRYDDALAALPGELGPGPWTMIANLPYNVGTPLVMKVLTEGSNIDRMIVMVQREVADRMLARRGTRTYGIPSVVTSLHAEARREFTVGPQVFVPAPQVESAVVSLQRKPSSPYAARAVEIAAAAFNQRRKMVRRSLDGIVASLGQVLEDAGIPGEARAEQLSPEDFLHIAEAEENHV